jgi:hypothetical protein
LHIDIGGREELYENGDSTSIDELLSVVICDKSAVHFAHQRWEGHTRMGHVEQRTGSVSLNPHVLGLCKSGQGSESSRSGNLGLVVFVRCQIGYASHGVTLDLDIGGHHLSDERGEATEPDNLNLVLGCIKVSIGKYIIVIITQGSRTYC